MSKVRKDKASFKIVKYERQMFFFMKKDDWGSYWYLRNFKLFRIIDGEVCYKDEYIVNRFVPFDKEVQDAYQNWLVESILLGDK